MNKAGKVKTAYYIIIINNGILSGLIDLFAF